MPLAKDQDLEVLPDPFLAFSPPQYQVILDKDYIHLLPKGPEVKRALLGVGPSPFANAFRLATAGQAHSQVLLNEPIYDHSHLCHN